ncbi:MAG: radical SAM protein [Gemmatimonadales bacterium]
MMTAEPTTISRRAHAPVEYAPGDPRFPEVMLYFGNDCNRDCYFCCVEAKPGGSFLRYTPDRVGEILELIHPAARIKLYGGEPTLYHRHLIEVTAALRGGGYVGRLTIFSNGIQADRLIEMLEADPAGSAHPGSDVYLNYAIWHGRGVEQIPAGRRAKLVAWAAAHPGRIYLSHEDLIPVGGAERAPADTSLPQRVPDFGGKCARCFPTLKSDGTIHACAFAAEEPAAQYALGRLGDPPQEVASRYRQFLGWVEQVLEPAAAAAGESPCTVCLRWARAEPAGGHLASPPDR